MKKLNIFASILFSITMVLLLSGGSWQIAATLAGLFFIVSFLPQVSGVLKVVVSNPLIGKSKKSMGNATFSTWKGINVLKEKAVSVANPQTDAQLRRRNALSQIVAAFRFMPSAIRAGFKKLAIKKSEFNAFSSYNLKNAFTYISGSTAVFVPADALISKGTIALTPIAAAPADRSNNAIAFSWDAGSLQPGQSTTDVPIMAAYNITLNEWTGEIGDATRADEQDTLALPANWATGNTLRVYLGFYNPFSGESSDSDNKAETIVA